jgi:C-3',4' desaturase CrtD
VGDWIGNADRVTDFIFLPGKENEKVAAMTRAIVVGAGIGGLTTAAVLARAGLDVTVLEAQVYPGGCASTFYHQGYRFDSGATLAAGFYPGGPMDQIAEAAGIDSWPMQPQNLAMVVHLPDDSQVNRWTGKRRWDEYRYAFGQEGVDFFRWQENTADAMWHLALRSPAWPPQTVKDFQQMLATGADWLRDRNAVVWPQFTRLAVDAFRPVSSHLGGVSDRLRMFVDGQLLISAQTISNQANALYGAAALDLPRRGTVTMAGGMGAIAETLVEAIRENGGRVVYRQEVTRIRTNNNRPVSVETKRGDTFPADIVIVNLPPWNAAELFVDDLPVSLRRLPEFPKDGWGAFMLYLGVDNSIIPADFPLHHQIIVREPLGEGNSIFVSISPEWDHTRAPMGQRSMTVSTHTNLRKWWELFEHNREEYENKKAAYAQLTMSNIEKVIPGLRDAARLVLPGTPVTFQRFTRRKWGWVGGFPQTSLVRAFGARLGKNMWLVGDSIFPGQSTAAVALGGLRVANAVLNETKQVVSASKEEQVL